VLFGQLAQETDPMNGTLMLAQLGSSHPTIPSQSSSGAVEPQVWAGAAAPQSNGQLQVVSGAAQVESPQN
jgi:hypothetical protein